MMAGINKVLTFVAVCLCFFVGAAASHLGLMLLSILIALGALVLEHYALPKVLHRIRHFRNF